MLCLNVAGWVANIVDPDEMPHSVASHQGLQCLLKTIRPKLYGKFEIWAFVLGRVLELWNIWSLTMLDSSRVFFCFVFFCVEVLRPSQPNGVMSSAVTAAVSRVLYTCIYIYKKKKKRADYLQTFQYDIGIHTKTRGPKWSCIAHLITRQVLSQFVLSVQAKKFNIDFQDCGHLGFPIRMILATFDLQVISILPMKFRVN